MERDSAFVVKPDISHCRGMSEPFGFEFSLLNKHRTMLVHAVIFASFETFADTRQIDWPVTPEQDPRMDAFINYAFKNFAEQRKKLLNVQLDGLEKQIASRTRELKEMEHIIKNLKKESEHVE